MGPDDFFPVGGAPTDRVHPAVWSVHCQGHGLGREGPMPAFYWKELDLRGSFIFSSAYYLAWPLHRLIVTISLLLASELLVQNPPPQSRPFFLFVPAPTLDFLLLSVVFGAFLFLSWSPIHSFFRGLP